MLPSGFHSLILWVDEDGWLSSLEVVDVADEHGEFNPIPPPSMYEPPRIDTEKAHADTPRGFAAIIARVLGRKP